ncbi:MAG TPA: sigma-54 dependent transcriptional regulator, partial [Pyrinomonadaceae bacterium]
GFFEKPFDEEEVSHIVAQAARVRCLESEVLKLRSELKMHRGFGRFVGTSAALERTLKQARAVADTSATVLITGENGTGKEVLARAIHEESGRRDRPFVAVSCAALPESLIESELFGHVKGAFTDAKSDRVGRFELADGGTLFLDEIANIPVTHQAKLLRVVETGEFERVGSSKTRRVDVRILSATNADLREEVAAGKFRQDLLFRLNTVEIALPPLRERQTDIPLLALYFLDAHARRYRKQLSGFDEAALQSLARYAWPGNVRELNHAVERAVLMARSGSVTAADLGLDTQREAQRGLEEMSLDEVESYLIKKTLARFDGNVGQAAEALGLSRSALYRRLQRYGL